MNEQGWVFIRIYYLPGDTVSSFVFISNLKEAQILEKSFHRRYCIIDVLPVFSHSLYFFLFSSLDICGNGCFGGKKKATQT